VGSLHRGRGGKDTSSPSSVSVECDSVGSLHRGRGGTPSSVSVECDSVGSLHRGRGGKDTSSSSRHPEFSRSMSSDNWRESKKREVETDATSSWRSRQEHSRPGAFFIVTIDHLPGEVRDVESKRGKVWQNGKIQRKCVVARSVFLHMYSGCDLGRPG